MNCAGLELSDPEGKFETDPVENTVYGAMEGNVRGAGMLLVVAVEVKTVDVV